MTNNKIVMKFNEAIQQLPTLGRIITLNNFVLFRLILVFAATNVSQTPNDKEATCQIATDRQSYN